MSISDLERQEIIQTTLEKAFAKFVKKGLVSAEKANALSLELAQGREALLQAESKRIEGMLQNVTSRIQSLKGL